jgi:hypothetical protein
MTVEQLHPEEVWRELEWRKCAPKGSDPAVLLDGFLYFCTTYWYIKTPDQGRIKFDLFDAQRDTVHNWIDHRYTLVLKARQLGFSTLVSAYAFWASYFYEDRTIVMLSRTERDAIKLLQKAKYGYRFLPEWLKFRGPPVNTTQTKMEFANESYVESLPSASDPARGESLWLAILDELAFLPNGEEAWSSIEPTVDIGGRVIAMSTANGEGNLFHNLWIGGVAGTNRFKTIFHPWWANGRSEEWYEQKKRDLPDWQLAQEYPDNAEEAFLRSGRPVFNLDMLATIVPEPPLMQGHFEKLLRWRFISDHDGPMKVWEPPVVGGKYVIGGDVSEGLEHGDFSSMHVINARNGQTVCHWHGRIDPDLFGSDVIAPIGRWYNNALVGVESNNHGLVTLKALQREKYTPLYMQRSPRYKKSVPTDILGWRTTAVTKPVAIDELNRMLREGEVTLPCADTLAELRTFVRDDNGRMHGSPFDDRTMSLAIAADMLKYVWLKQYEVEKKPGPGTMNFLEMQLYGDDPLFQGRKKGKVAPPPIGGQFVRSQRG